MGLNDKITIKFSALVDNSKHDILSKIADGKKNNSWTDFLVVDSIDFGGIDIYDNRLEIIRCPTMLNAFRPWGKISIDFDDLPDNKTNLNIEIIPYNGYLPLIIGLLISFLILWTIAVIAFGNDWYAFLMIISAWTIFGTILYLKFLYTKHGLIDYSRRVINVLTRDIKASR